MMVSCYNLDVEETAAYEELTLPFGRALKYLRVQAGLTQERLAELLDVGQSTVATWEKQAAAIKDPLMLAELADLLDTSSDDLEAGKVKRRKRTRPIVEDEPDELRRLKENFLALDQEAAEKLLQESEWLRRVTERGHRKVAEERETYQAEG